MLQVRLASFIYFWGIGLYLTINGRVDDRQASFGHHFLYIPIAERAAKVSANAAQDDYGLIMPPFKWVFHEAASGTKMK